MGKVFMLYGDGDYNFIGDDVISYVFWFFIIVYIGDGIEDGFDFVVVSNFFLFFRNFYKLYYYIFCNL